VVPIERWLFLGFVMRPILQALVHVYVSGLDLCVYTSLPVEAGLFTTTSFAWAWSGECFA
jgi:hypothetical protein